MFTPHNGRIALRLVEHDTVVDVQFQPHAIALHPPHTIDDLIWAFLHQAHKPYTNAWDVYQTSPWWNLSPTNTFDHPFATLQLGGVRINGHPCAHAHTITITRDGFVHNGLSAVSTPDHLAPWRPIHAQESQDLLQALPFHLRAAGLGLVRGLLATPTGDICTPIETLLPIIDTVCAPSDHPPLNWVRRYSLTLNFRKALFLSWMVRPRSLPIPHAWLASTALIAMMDDHARHPLFGVGQRAASLASTSSYPPLTLHNPHHNATSAHDAITLHAMRVQLTAAVTALASSPSPPNT